MDEYNAKLEILNTLSDKERNYVTPGREYRNIDKSNMRYYYIHRINGKPVGFIDIYNHPRYPNVGNALLAVHKDYRGMGIASMMILHACEQCKRIGVDIIQYEVLKSNAGSIATIESIKKRNIYKVTKETNKEDKNEWMYKIYLK